MLFAPSKCKILLQDWIGSNPNLVLAAGEQLGLVDSFGYLGRMSDEVRSPIEGDFHLLVYDVCPLSIKGRAYMAAVNLRSRNMNVESRWAKNFESSQNWQRMVGEFCELFRF